MLLWLHRWLPSSSQPADVGDLLRSGTHPWWVDRLAPSWHLRSGHSGKPSGGERVDRAYQSNPSQLHSHWLQTGSLLFFQSQLIILSKGHELVIMLVLHIKPVDRSGQAKTQRIWKRLLEVRLWFYWIDNCTFYLKIRYPPLEPNNIFVYTVLNGLNLFYWFFFMDWYCIMNVWVYKCMKCLHNIPEWSWSQLLSAMIRHISPNIIKLHIVIVHRCLFGS